MMLRLGTRGSDLARTQATTIAQRLALARHEIELVVIRTAGDQSTAASFGAIGPQGVFVRELEEALLAGTVDLAVHSFKDLPTRSPTELVIAASPARADAADVLLLSRAAHTSEAAALLPLERGARVGTASARRQVWLKHFRPDLVVVPLRGNVPTRIERLREGRYDAIVLAAAGIERLRGPILDTALAGLVSVRLDPARFVPAPAQGALAVQCRRDRGDVVAALAGLDDAATRVAVGVERAALARAEGGCDVAFGAHCRASGAKLELDVMLERDGQVHATRVRGNDPATLDALAWRSLGVARARP